MVGLRRVPVSDNPKCLEGQPTGTYTLHKVIGDGRELWPPRLALGNRVLSPLTQILLSCLSQQNDEESSSS